jgi:integrase
MHLPRKATVGNRASSLSIRNVRWDGLRSFHTGETMSVIKRDNSKNWYIQFQMDGRNFIRSSRTTNKRAAEQLEVEWKAKLHAEHYLGERQRISLKAALEQFCFSKAGTPNHGGLLYSSKVVLRLLPGRRALDEFTSHDLERFKRDRLAEGVKPQTLKHNLNLVLGAWKYAKKLGYQVSPLEMPKLRLPKSPLRYLTDDEEARFLACLDPRREGKGLRAYAERDDETKRCMQDAYDLVVLLLDTGARYSEIANIEWSRVNLDERAVYLWRPKVQNEAVLYLTDRSHAILTRRHQQRSGPFVFASRSGGARGYASQSIRKALRRAGLADCRIHTLRHTHASRLIQNGLSVYEVREVLGHTDIKTTMRYAHLETRQVTSKARDVINRLNSRPTPSP